MTTPATQTLADWLLAEIAEDEAAARAATAGRWGVESHPTNPPKPMGVIAVDRTFVGVVAILGDNPGDLAHIARYDPARVLAQCAAHRAIVELHSGVDGACQGCGLHEAWPPGRSEPTLLPMNDPCPTLRALASVYADRDGWREEWGA